MPKVSIIIPTQRRHALLVEAVESILRQTFHDFEVIIVGSGAGTTPATTAAGRRFTEADAHIRFIYGSEGGISKARNIGTDLARGEWIAFLDNDDLWLPHKLELQLAAAQVTGGRSHCDPVHWLRRHG